MIARMEITDRYGGRPPRGPVCKGQCEGLGWVPIREGDLSEPWHTLWRKAEAERLAQALRLDSDDPEDRLQLSEAEEFDGTHFVTCPDCKGTGRLRPNWWRIGFKCVLGMIASALCLLPLLHGEWYGVPVSSIVLAMMLFEIRDELLGRRGA